MSRNRHLARSDRARVRRLPERAHYDAAAIDAILDEALSCTIAFQWEGSVHAMTTAHWRAGPNLYVHGAKSSRMLKALLQGQSRPGTATNRFGRELRARVR